MELTPEEKLRIEGEERRRVSEEQYRAEVRAKLQGESAPIKQSPFLWVMGVGVIVVTSAIVLSSTLGRKSTPTSEGTDMKERCAAMESWIPANGIVTPADARFIQRCQALGLYRDTTPTPAARPRSNSASNAAYNQQLCSAAYGDTHNKSFIEETQDQRTMAAFCIALGLYHK